MATTRRYSAMRLQRMVDDTMEAGNSSASEFAHRCGVSPNVIHRVLRRESVRLEHVMVIVQECGWELAVRKLT